MSGFCTCLCQWFSSQFSETCPWPLKRSHWSPTLLNIGNKLVFSPSFLDVLLSSNLWVIALSLAYHVLPFPFLWNFREVRLPCRKERNGQIVSERYITLFQVGSHHVLDFRCYIKCTALQRLYIDGLYWYLCTAQRISSSIFVWNLYFELFKWGLVCF